MGVGEGINILFALEAFDYALANRSVIRSTSSPIPGAARVARTTPTTPINQASYEAYKRGMVVAFAAGNDGRATTP